MQAIRGGENGGQAGDRILKAANMGGVFRLPQAKKGKQQAGGLTPFRVELAASASD